MNEQTRKFAFELTTLILVCVLIGLVTYIVTRPLVAALDDSALRSTQDHGEKP